MRVTYHILMYGEGALGKSTMARKFCDSFCRDLEGPSGSGFMMVEHWLSDLTFEGEEILFGLYEVRSEWQEGVDEGPTGVIAHHLEKSQGLMLLCDLSQELSDQVVENFTYLKNLFYRWNSHLAPSTPTLIVGTKSDLRNDTTATALQRLASDWNVEYLEVSTVSGDDSALQPFIHLLREIQKWHQLDAVRAAAKRKRRAEAQARKKQNPKCAIC